MIKNTAIFFLALFIVIFPFQREVFGASDEVETIRPVHGVPVPLYPVGDGGGSAIINAGAESEFAVESYLRDGYIVKLNKKNYFAKSVHFAPVYLLNSDLKGKASAAGSFSGVKLPDEIERSEFFFTSADKKSFYSLAFLFFLKYGGKYDKYDESLKLFDDFIIGSDASSKKAGLLKVLSDYLLSVKIDCRAFLQKNIDYCSLLQCLRFKRPVIFISTVRRSAGDIMIFFDAREVSAGNVIFKYYSYPDGISEAGIYEIIYILANAVRGYLVLL